MFVETVAGSLEVILGYFVIVPLIIKLVSSVISVAGISAMILYGDSLFSKSHNKLHLISRFLGYSLATTNYQLKIRTYFGENS